MQADVRQCMYIVTYNLMHIEYNSQRPRIHFIKLDSARSERVKYFEDSSYQLKEIDYYTDTSESETTREIRL